MSARAAFALAQASAPLSVRHYGASHGSHSHGHFQVLLGLSGVLELEIEGRGQRLGAGAGCVIAPRQQHDFEASAGSTCLVLDTTDKRWAACDAQPASPAQASALALYLSHALRQPSITLQLHAPALLLNAWRAAAPGPLTPVTLFNRRRVIDWLQLATWVQQHLHRPLTAADLAARVFLSPTQFAVRCRTETGQTAMQWLRFYRLAHAHSLRATGMKQAEVAERCGYQSPSALTAAMAATLRRRAAGASAATPTVVTRR